LCTQAPSDDNRSPRKFLSEPFFWDHPTFVLLLDCNQKPATEEEDPNFTSYFVCRFERGPPRL
jgi:hypothetical protein